jgi:adenine-specific DNA-methyltransferase
MARGRRSGSDRIDVETFTHGQAKRWNIPTAELQSLVREEEAAPTKTEYPRKYSPETNPEMYARNPDLDPQLVWRGKDEQDRNPLTVDTVPIYVQEKIHPKAIIDDLKRVSKEGIEPPIRDLFADFNGLPDTEAKYEFYAHAANWSNRMILGDSLLVMNSLAEKEGLRGQVQMIYIDPPYGIKFQSNWQVSTKDRDVKDGQDGSATREPDVIRAFRDTWSVGVHSYLAYLRDRCIAVRELLSESGSVFVQISDENAHLVRSVLDEVFGSNNFVGVIAFVTTGGQSSVGLSKLFDLLIWYARDASLLKYREVYLDKGLREGGGWSHSRVEFPDGSRSNVGVAKVRDFFSPDTLSDHIYQDALLSQGATATGSKPFSFQDRTYHPSSNHHWKTTIDGMSRLARANRIEASTNSIRFARFLDDFPVQPITNVWDDTNRPGYIDEKRYVVQDE